VLVAGAAALASTLARLQASPLGFDPGGVAGAELAPPGLTTLPVAERRAFYLRALERLATLPGLEAAGLATRLPLTGSGASAGLRVEGRTFAPGAQPDAVWRAVSIDYHRTLRIPLRAGRLFDDRDGAEGPPVAVVNETLARTAFPGLDAVGRRIGTGLDGDGAPVTIVGVVADVPQEALGTPARPELHRPLAQPSSASLDSLQLVFRAETGRDPLALAPSVRAALRELASDAPLGSIAALDELGKRSLARERLAGGALAAAALVARALASVGLFGLLAGLVAERSPELGVRLALGATPGGLVRLVLASGLRLVAVGLAAGVVATAALSRTAAGLLHGAQPADPPLLAAVAAVLLAVGAAAGAIPARRAARLDPAEVLRRD
jgi:predicted permease